MTENNHKPRFAIMGSGGIGGFIGARLVRAGFDTTFIARGAHLDAMRSSGLRIGGEHEEFVVDPVNATANPADVGPVDFVIFAVKLWDTDVAGKMCLPFIGSETAIISMQNGVNSETDLARIVGDEHVMGGVAEIGARIAEPGKIVRISPFAIVRFGELNGHKSLRSERFKAALESAGIEVDHAEDISKTLWSKFLFLVGFSALTALTRHPIGDVRQDPDTRRLLVQVMEEVVAVGKARKAPINEEELDARLKYIDGLPPQVQASMASDLAAGGRLELPWLSGAVSRMSGDLQVPTPANDFVYAALKLDAGGRK